MTRCCRQSFVVDGCCFLFCSFIRRSIEKHKQGVNKKVSNDALQCWRCLHPVQCSFSGCRGCVCLTSHDGFLTSFAMFLQRLSSVDVVGVTCAASTFPLLEGMVFPILLLDECSQMTEPASLIPIARSVGVASWSRDP